MVLIRQGIKGRNTSRKILADGRRIYYILRVVPKGIPMPFYAGPMRVAALIGLFVFRYNAVAILRFLLY